MEQCGWSAILLAEDTAILESKEVLAAANVRHLPVIVLAGRIGEEKVVELLKLGVSDVVLRDNLARLVPALRRSLREAEERCGRQLAEVAAQRSEQHYRDLFENMNEGLAYCRMIFEDGQPTDFVYLAVNEQFGRLTGLQGVVGKRYTEVVPGTRASDPELFAVYGRVAATGRPEKFERQNQALQIWFHISVYRPEPGCFVALIDVITERKQIEEALRQSQERYVLTERAVNDGLWDWNILTDEDRFSPRWKEILGYAEAELENHKSAFLNLLHPEDLPRVKAATRDHLERGLRYAIEYRLRHKDGSYRWVYSRGEALRTADGRPTRMVGAITDITQRRLAEQQLAQSNSLLGATLDSTADGILVADGRGRIIGLNRKFLELWRIPAEMAASKDDRLLLRYVLDQLVEPAAFLAKVEELYQTPEAISWDELKFHDGRVFERYSQPQRLDNTVIGRVWSFRDISKRKQSEAALHRLSQMLRLVLDNIPAYVFWKDRELRYLGCNRLFAQAAGIDNSLSIAGKTDFDLAWAKNAEEYRADDLQVLTSRSPKLNFEESQVRPDGSVLWLKTSKTPLTDQHGEVIGVLGIYMDITERRRAELALRESEVAFRALAESMPQIVFAAKADGLNAYFNQKWVDYTGFALTESYGAAWLKTFHPEDQHRAWEVWQKATREGSEYALECRIRRADGHYRWWLIRSTPYRDAQGQILEWFGTCTDIDDIKQAETTVRESRAKLEAALASMTDAVSISDSAGQFIEFNDAFVSFHRFQHRSECARNLAAYPAILDVFLTAGEVAPMDRWPVSRALRGEIATNAEYTLRRKDTGETWVGNYSFSPIRDKAGAIVGSVVVARDITERKRVEESHTRLATAVEQAGESIAITDLRGTMLYVNPSYERTSGYPRAELIGRNPRMLKSGKQSDEFYRHLWATITRGEVWSGRMVNRRKDGTLYEETATISPIFDIHGKLINYVAVKRDISREVELESQFRQSQKMEAIGQLAGGVAHDFNNILAAMLMQSELTGMVENIPDEVRDGLREIRACAERAANLTRQLLLFSRRQVMQSQDLDLNEAVTNLAKMLQRIIGEDVRLHLELQAGPMCVHADAGMLDQVLMNLTVNARDAMPQGGTLTIATARRVLTPDQPRPDPEVAPGTYLTLMVSDTGAGIAPEILPRIFEPFFTTKAAGKGTGLGLATVFGIVKQHRGWIEVQSELGRGTSVQIHLPICAAVQVEEPDEADFSLPRGGTETILVAEDEAPVRRLIRSLLERCGYRVLEAANGVEALEIWQHHHSEVALLLTDMVMPAGITGQQLARRLQGDNPALKVIFTTGYSPEIAGRSIDLRSGENFLQKPFAPTLLLETVRQCLDAPP